MEADAPGARKELDMHIRQIVFALLLAGTLSACDTVNKLMKTDLEGRLGTYLEQSKVFRDAVEADDEERKK